MVQRDLEHSGIGDAFSGITSFVGTAHQIVDAWQTVFASWLPGSGYQPDDRPCYELYRGDPGVDAKTRTFRCDLCLPVRPL